MTPEALSELESLRARITSGNYTIEDCRRAVQFMREGRAIAAEASATSRTKSYWSPQRRTRDDSTPR